MADERMTREQFENFEFCHGCVDDEPFQEEALRLLDERDAAVALLRRLYLEYKSFSLLCHWCLANISDHTLNAHEATCPYVALLATLTPAEVEP